MTVRLQGAPLDPWAELAAHPGPRPGASGATAVFVGTMRDFNQGEAVAGMTLEHYPDMTLRHLERIAAEARARWTLDDVLVVHRHGLLGPGDPIVLVAAWAAHRGAALEACRYLIEELKHRAPFWKKEIVPGGERWVARNTPG